VRPLPRRKTDTRHADIRDALRGLGAVVVDLAAVGNGVPDMAALWRGRTVWLEVKSPGELNRNRPTDKRQRKFAEAASAAGVTVHRVVTPEEAVRVVF